MVAVATEIENSRTGTEESFSRKYLVTGSNDEADVIAAIKAAAPTSIGGIGRSGVGYEETDDYLGYFEGTATYSVITSGTPKQFETGSSEYRFNFVAPSAHIYQSLETISSTARSGETAPDFEGAINVVSDNGKLRVEGIQLSPPPETFTYVFYPANSVISSAYQSIVENLCGLANNNTFRGRPAGSMMLTRCVGGARNNEDWSIEFGFGYTQNRDSIPVGPITVPHKDGMDLLWAFYEDSDDAEASQLIKRPKAAYVERVFYRGDFNVLGF